MPINPIEKIDKLSIPELNIFLDDTNPAPMIAGVEEKRKSYSRFSINI